MKKYFFVYFLTVSVGLLAALNAQAQDTTSLGHNIKEGAKKTSHAIGKGAKKVGNKTAELAAKGKAGVVDRVYEEKQGPHGEKIYIDKNSKYYWIDKKGHRRFVAARKLKDKTK
jgi:hypothetical protein